MSSFYTAPVTAAMRQHRATCVHNIGTEIKSPLLAGKKSPLARVRV